MTQRICSISGCAIRHMARGWCNSHYLRWYQYGDPEFVPERPQGCTVAGCSREHKGHGLCNMHLVRQRRHGDPTVVGTSGRPLKGDLPTWATIHKRLMAKRGRAAEYPCVDCGKTAREWSYNGKDENEIVAEDHGWVLAWSLDLANYDPRCVSCHRLYDNAARIGRGLRNTLTITELPVEQVTR